MPSNPPSAQRARVAPSFRPTRQFLLSHPAHCIALGFGAGLLPIAPGTAGTLWAWGAYGVLQLFLPQAWIGVLIAVSIPLGWWACTVTAGRMRIDDPGSVVWDEVVAFWIVLWLIMPTGFSGQAGAFVLFRFFDALKPQPVRWADSVFHGKGARGGWGIMFDDLVAALCALLVIALCNVLLPQWSLWT